MLGVKAGWATNRELLNLLSVARFRFFVHELEVELFYSEALISIFLSKIFSVSSVDIGSS